jgi:2-polyprenyl-6-hydroxyphenyl methylase / 3-demethylubiquinone-9 3-methyltransferase
MRRGHDVRGMARRLVRLPGAVFLCLLCGCMSTPSKIIAVPTVFAAAPLRAILEQEDRSVLGLRNLAFLPVRLTYIAQVLEARGIVLPALRVLVVNGGDSGIAAALAAAGASVTVLDQDDAALQRAKSNAQRFGLASSMQFLATRLDVGMRADASFALAVVSNTFELTHDKPATLAALAGMLAPGGLIVFDTINGSGPSRAIYLGAFQALPLTSFVPSGTYANDRFVAPRTLGALGAAQGLQLESVTGFMPGDVFSLVVALIGRKFGRVRDADLAQRAQMKLSGPSGPGAEPPVTYFGVLVKRAVQ